ncbi:MAG: DUF455 family protein [Bacteriovoracaceae bacterium]|nr:DUF455 family protein [Bacteriovoracaceae bacterium]
MQSWAKQLLLGGDLSDKLQAPYEMDFEQKSELLTLPQAPGRIDKYKFVTKSRDKFPKPQHLHQDSAKGKALHAFANHELLAIEMMAATLLMFPHENDEHKKIKKGIIQAIQDEQKHLSLYIARMNELGFEFGDFHLNDFFWRQMGSIQNIHQYLAVMSLTFEAANLDFSYFYAQLFKEIGDEKTAAIMQTVYEDEISHVALGSHFLGRWKGDKKLWDYYQEILPWPITPARAKGLVFHADSRLQAGLDADFVDNLKNYRGDFQVTKRKQWEVDASLSS